MQQNAFSNGLDRSDEVGELIGAYSAPPDRSWIKGKGQGETEKKEEERGGEIGSVIANVCVS